MGKLVALTPDFDPEPELDRLFALAPAEFVDARNALAARLKGAGRAEESARVKALKKPTAPAWAVNQLRFSAPALLDALHAAADRLRASPADVRDAMASRREALAAARAAAERLLESSGLAATPQTLQRVTATLEAVATYGKTPGRPVAGRLTEELAAPGIEDLAALGFLPTGPVTPSSIADAEPPASPTASAPVTEPPAPKPVPVPQLQSAELVRLRDLAGQAAKRLTALTREVEAVRARLAELETLAESARKRREELERELADAVHLEQRAEAAVATARTELNGAERAVREAAQSATAADAAVARFMESSGSAR